MTESVKPLYELRPRGKHYQGIWQGEHCLAAICVKKQRGARDAQFLLRAANSYKELLAACEGALRLRNLWYFSSTTPEHEGESFALSIMLQTFETVIAKAKGE